ncbi:MAG TPA: ABC transporter permease subunit [Polyangiaceae bacterium]|nr:ABC transporter permease subunit [Polyangiaceae bacterium]
MRHALRRVLWIGPTLVLMSALLFAFLSHGKHHPTQGRAPLPRFFQPDPVSVRQTTQALTARIAAGGPDADAAARRLEKIGGAALPHVLPELDALPPNQRARVALALTPIAYRIGLGSREELKHPETAVLFWNRFWQDRSIDFRPGVAKRAVRRIAQRASEGRRDDVIGLDTYALAELIAALPNIRAQEHVEQMARVTPLLAHITGQPWTIKPDASLDEARSLRLVWRQWWREHRLDYVALDGPERVLAMLTETEFGRWAENAVYARLGANSRGQSVLDVLASRAPLTLALAWLAILFGYAGAFLAAMAVAANARVDRYFSPGALMVVALPCAVFAGGAAHATESLRFCVGLLVMTLATSALLLRYQRLSLRNELAQDAARTRRAFGHSELSVARLSSRNASSALLSLLGRDMPTLLSLAFVVEHALSLDGLGSVTIEAVRVGDTTWLMAVGLGIMAFAALLQITSVLALARLDPRLRDAGEEAVQQ